MNGEPDPSRPLNPTLAREHLANERTYLAWLRTATAVMAFGLAVAGFAREPESTSIIAGGLLVAAGALGVVYGTARYRQVADQLERNTFIFGGRGRAAITASGVLVASVVAALVLLVLARH